jgi:glycerol transport system ATP-binding protein
MAEVSLQHVSHRYPGADSLTLNDLSLRIEPGTRHALLGSSGAGKTTLLNMLSGLEAPSAGRILIDGRDVSEVAPAARNVTQVFQFPVLYESLSVAHNLQFPLKTRGVSATERRRRADEIAQRLGIADLLERKPGSLSLFQKQLVAIGRALVRPDVSLVLLDEPLTAVEPATKWQLRRVLKQVQKELGATMIYVTHDQTEALTFADRISVLHRGEVLQTGSADRLVNKPSHEYVASFIGTPGMNLLPGAVRGQWLMIGEHAVCALAGAAAGPCTVGFRPEWARVAKASVGTSGIPIDIVSVRTSGVRAGHPVGVVAAQLDGRPVNVRQTLDVGPGGDHHVLQVDGAVAFREGRLLAARNGDA